MSKNIPKVPWGFFSILLIVCVFNVSLLAQGKGNIKGKIVDKNNNPVSFANVVVEGTTTGAAANENGNYTISNLNADS